MYHHPKYVTAKAMKETLGAEEGKNAYMEKFCDELEDMIKDKKPAYYKWLRNSERESRELNLKQQMKLSTVQKKMNIELMCSDIVNIEAYNKSTKT